MSYQTPSQYHHNKSMQEQTPFRIIDGYGYYIVNDIEIPKATFESTYPIDKPIKCIKRENFKGNNPDSTSLA